MVEATMAWLSGTSKNVNTHIRHRHHKSAPAATLGILSFETAKIMCRLVSLYRSLTDDEIHKLRKAIMKSEGVMYLNSKDEGFLLNLAGAERLEDLNRAAITVSRLGQKCTDFGLNRFDLVYTDLKLGIIDLGKLQFDSRSVGKIVDKMEKFIARTSSLFVACENLTELEASERKLLLWKKNLSHEKSPQSNFNYFQEKITFQKEQVQRYRENSLWNQTFDNAVGIMARIVCIIYARICVVFGPYISGLPCLSKNTITKPHSNQKHQQQIRVHPENDYCLLAEKENWIHRPWKSGPIPKNPKKTGLVQFRIPEKNPVSIPKGENSGGIGKNNRVFQSAPPSTVGGSGLSLRYANVILLAEMYLHAPSPIEEEAREYLYEMLPESLKTRVSWKLKGHWLKREEECEEREGYSLAGGWREALEGIMGWLVPMAQDTVKWQAERNMEKQKFDSKPTVLLLQTLHYSDKEKAEAAIVEVLVGLSCIYRYENRRRPRGGGCGGNCHR